MMRELLGRVREVNKRVTHLRHLCHNHKHEKHLQDLELLKCFKSEIQFELASNHFQNAQRGSLGDFVVDLDSRSSQDVFLRRKFDSGEEVALSAILGPPNYEKDLVFSRDVFMKVCVKKPALSSILQFDCEVREEPHKGSDFYIYNAYYLRSPTCLTPSIYRGPLFSTLDKELQHALKEYLIAKGIEVSLTNFLLHYLHKREQEQYLNWLKKGEAAFVAKERFQPETLIKKFESNTYLILLKSKVLTDISMPLHGIQIVFFGLRVYWNRILRS
ncbi:Mam33 [Mucuna pruriens]|uniref:Mam33 n=1 Tax=Mucuna pruriens TaxID=157652 RepID=A0A371FY58_MUCPR|nr:Mam33 [Mucuna pruriens]